MLGLPLGFTVPLALVALAALPALYFLLRITPPRPRRVPFPPLRLILDLEAREETPARTPWWLLALRLLIAALIILAMAGPVWNPQAVGDGASGLLIIVDDGWPTAPTWDLRMTAAARRITAVERHGGLVAVAATGDAGREIVPGDGTKAMERLRALKPLPYVPDRLALVAPVTTYIAAHPAAQIVWFADGVERGHASAFAEKLSALSHNVTVVTDNRPVLALAGPSNDSGALDVRVLRANASGAQSGVVRALDLKGLPLGQAPFTFGGGAEAKAHFDLPVELRNEIARLDIVGESAAGAVSLLDERWRRLRVGLVSGETADVSQPLLAPTYYLAKALGPFADVREAKPGTPDPIGSLLDDHVAVMVLADVGTVSGPAYDKLARFVENGGLLLRFAGTRLAGASDDLVPVRLRRGGRVLGGALSWETPKKLAPFDPQSPFAGLTVPDEVTVQRQVLAEPEPGLPAKTWAQLSDGTPLVTAAKRGKGLIVLFHLTADTTWSNLPLSGLFVDMLRRVVAMASDSGRAAQGVDAQSVDAKAGAAPDTAHTVTPTRTLDGFGVLGTPPATAKPVAVGSTAIGDAEHPPGFYGPPDALFAVNALAPTDSLATANYSGLGFDQAPLGSAAPVDLRPSLITAAFLLFALDGLVSFWLGGGFRRRPRLATSVAVVLGLALAGSLIAPPSARAENTTPAVSQRDIESALTTRLAYVASGDARVDEISRQGLQSLSLALAARTSLTPGDPIGIDPARDELAFYPLLYWPIVADAPQPSPLAVERAAAFMRQGGTIIFDTRDALATRPDGPPTPEARWLRRLLTGVDVPELEPVPADHVVTKTFYLLDGFVGRYTVGQTWIEALPPPDPNGDARPARSGDGVSPIIITSNDLAAGWASDRTGEALYSLVPGGARQHEMALRGGINLVMYTLTGNYKADQVHVRDLLERLAH